MKRAFVVIIVMPCCTILGQGTFQNLDFESANLSSIPAGQYGRLVPITSALPGWFAEFGTTPVTQVVQNDISLGSPSIDVFGPNWCYPPGILDGSYSVALQSGLGPGLIEENASLWQDGTIPANAQSLQFIADNFGGATPPSVSFAGDPLSLFVLSSGMSPSGQPYNVYGANIASFAGQTGQLEFTATFSGAVNNSIVLDDISFSPEVIPEPNSLVLSGIGGVLFALCRRFATKGR